MSADRTPAPVAVPEGGWQDGDWMVSTAAVVYHFVGGEFHRGEHAWPADFFGPWFERGAMVYVHAPRPEPVVAPLPTEAVERVRTDMMNRASRAISGRVDAHRTPDLMKVINALLDAGYRLVPEDDEDTVRVPRQAVERLRDVKSRWARRHPASTGLHEAVFEFFDALDGPR